MWKKAEKIMNVFRNGKSGFSAQKNDSKNLDKKRQIDNSKIMLEEMHLLFDKGWDSLNRWSEIAIAGLGLEVSIVTFGFSENGILGDIGYYFSNLQDGWFILALFMAGAWLAAAVLFILAIAIKGKNPCPPDLNLLLNARCDYARRKYKRMETIHLYDELIEEYSESTVSLGKKVKHVCRMILAGVYCLTGGAVLLLILKMK